MPETIVTAECSECAGTVKVPANVITATPTGSRGGTYTFPCPLCGEASSRAYGPAVRDALMLAIGVKWILPPAELDEVNLDAPMLTHNDLLTFAIALWSASDAEILARAVL